MAKLPVLIVAPFDDLHARAVVEILARRQIAVEWVDFAALNVNVRLTLNLGNVVDACLFRLGDPPILLSEVRTIWWRRPRRPEDHPELDEVTRFFVRGEWEHFLEALEAFVAARWVNPPAANRRASFKGLQLVAARAEGLRVPRTALTNDPEAVRALAAEGIPLIYKRMGTTPRPLTATKALLPTDLERLDVLVNCPAIFQEHIDAKLDIRVTAIGTDLYAAEIDSQAGESPLDWRFDHTVPFRPHALDSETLARLHALMQRLGLVYGAIDLRLTPNGEYVFLEVNPSGQYLFIELLAQIPLSERMAAFLVS
jgi:glutathione synthase/RimK-type ligase-like ATP-grasp enzyme